MEKFVFLIESPMCKAIYPLTTFAAALLLIEDDEPLHPGVVVLLLPIHPLVLEVLLNVDVVALPVPVPPGLIPNVALFQTLQTSPECGRM